MLFGLMLNLYLWQFTRVPFTWYVALGSVATFLVGYLASWIMPGNRPQISFRAEKGRVV